VLLVARRLGRPLTTTQAGVIQLLAVAVLGFAVWALFASGAIIRIVEPIANWYAGQAFPTPTGSPLP